MMAQKILNLWNHVGFRRYFSNTVYFFLGKIFQMGIMFLVGVWVARYLGPEKFGLLSFARSFVGLFLAISTLGLDDILVRELVRNKFEKNVLLGTAFVLKLIGAIVAFFLIFLAIYSTNNETLTRFVVLLVATSLVFQSLNVVDLYFQSRVIAKFSVCAQVVSSIVSSLVRIFLILAKLSVVYFAAVISFDMFALGIGYILLYVRYVGGDLRSWKFDINCGKDLLKDSWPLIFSGIAIGIYMKIDQVMVKYMLNNKAVGLYSAAIRLCEIWYLIPVVIASSLFPAIINAKKKDSKLYYNRLQKLYNLMVCLAIAVALSSTFAADWLVRLVYGIQYIASVKILKLYIWSSVFVFLGVAYSKWLINENYTRKNFYRTILGAVANIILNIFFIRLYGTLGAAVATLISQFVANVLYDFFDQDVHFALRQKLKALILYDWLLKPIRNKFFIYICKNCFLK